MNKEQAITAVADLLLEYGINVTNEQAAKLVEIGMTVVAATIVPGARPNPEPEDGDVMTLLEWSACRGSQAIIPDDGSGYWATSSHYSWDFPVFSTPKPDWATHVVWFNK